MPAALVFAFVASLGIHAAALFGPDFDLATEPETPVLQAELKPMKVQQARGKVQESRKTLEQALERKPAAVASPTPVISAPAEVPSSAAPAPRVAETIQPVGSTLPERGRIDFVVESGDSGFSLGRSRYSWEISGNAYRLFSMIETTGLVSLFKTLRIEMESVGSVGSAGLRPDRFTTRRNGKETREKAIFDWDNMKVNVGERGEQALNVGAQDLLSLNFQLGFMSHPDDGSMIPVATGKKYGIYRLEILGDEEIEVPAGKMRTLHLRTPGVNTTELWLAYDYLLLPVKIRHLDAKGNSLVQLATEIQVSQ